MAQIAQETKMANLRKGELDKLSDIEANLRQARQWATDLAYMSATLDPMATDRIATLISSIGSELSIVQEATELA